MWHFLFLLLLVPESLLASTERREHRPRVPSNHKEEFSGVARRGARRSPMKFGANRGPITFGASEDTTQQINQPYEYGGNSVVQTTYSDNYIPERYPEEDRVHLYQQYVLPDGAHNAFPGERVRGSGRPPAPSQEPPARFQSVRQPAPITQVVEGDGNGLGANGVGLGLNAKQKQAPFRNREPAFQQSPYYNDAVRQSGVNAGAGGVQNVRFNTLQALFPNVPKEIRVGSATSADVSDGRPRKDLFTAVASGSRLNKGSVASPGQHAIAAAVEAQGLQTASSSQYQYETAEEVDDAGAEQQQQQQQQQQQGGYEQEGYGANQDAGQGGQRVGLGVADPAQVGIGSPNEVGSFGQSSLGQLGIGNSGISGLYGAGYEEFLKKHGSSGVLESLGIGHRTNPLFAALLLNNIIISNQKGKPPNALNYGEANHHYLGMMLKQYGKYLPYGLGSYGLYGYSASNNLHNSKAFGQYKHEHTV